MTMVITRYEWPAAALPKEKCSCCDRVINDGELVQIINVQGAKAGRVRQVVKLTCIATLVDASLAVQVEETRKQFADIRRSLANGLRYDV